MRPHPRTHTPAHIDSAELYGSLYHYPAQQSPAGTMRKIFDWDSGAYMGQIPEANQTYNVIGNMNEHALSIGETTAGGLEILQAQDDAIMDYGSLIWWVDGRVGGSNTSRDFLQPVN